jgi:hypothetical protein
MLKIIGNFFKNHYHSRYHEKYEHAKKLFVFDMVLLSVAVAVLGSGIFFYFWKPGLMDKIDLEISLSKGRVLAGEDVCIVIYYKNNSEINLLNTQLGLHAPVGFVVDRNITPVEKFSDESIFNVEKISAGASGSVEACGKLWVEPKKEEKITSILSYLPENKKYREQKFSSFILNLQDSVIKASLEAPEHTFANAKAPFVYKIANVGAENVIVDLEPVWTGHFETKEKSLSQITLPPKAQKIISGEIITPNKESDYKFGFSAFTYVKNTRIKIMTTEVGIQTTAPNFYLTAKNNSNKTYAEPNDSLRIHIAWKNNSKYAFENGKIKIQLSDGVVNSAETARANQAKIENGTMIIDKKNRTALSNIQPFAKDEFEILIKLADSFYASDENYLEIKPTLTAELEKSEGKQNFTANADALKIQLSTNASLTAEIKYYTDEGDQLGRGPLPPVVGETTKYWVFVKILNSVNPLAEPKFSAILAPWAQFTGKQSVTLGSTLNYAEQSKEVSWSYFEIPKNSQTGLFFEIAINPSPENAGKPIQLIKEIEFYGKDKITGKEFILNKYNLTNELK